VSFSSATQCPSPTAVNHLDGFRGMHGRVGRGAAHQHHRHPCRPPREGTNRPLAIRVTVQAFPPAAADTRAHRGGGRQHGVFVESRVILRAALHIRKVTDTGVIVMDTEMLREMSAQLHLTKTMGTECPHDGLLPFAEVILACLQLNIMGNLLILCIGLVICLPPAGQRYQLSLSA